MKTIATHNNTPTLIADLLQEANSYARKAFPKNTERAYRSDWKHFTTWCKEKNLSPLPASPETVAAYITMLAASHKTSSIERRLATISHLHRRMKHPSPSQSYEVQTVWRGIKNELGCFEKGKAPLLIDPLRTILSTMPATLTGIRDAAILLLGFASSLRASELVGLNIEDLEFTSEGVVLFIKKSKTDQQGKGRKIGIPLGDHDETCPVKAVTRWIEAAKIGTGPLFRPINRHGQVSEKRLTAQGVNIVVKRGLRIIGVSAKDYGAHSLRRGFATSAHRAGANTQAIRKQTGHKSLEVMMKYIDEASLFENNAAKKLGL